MKGDKGKFWYHFVQQVMDYGKILEEHMVSFKDMHSFHFNYYIQQHFYYQLLHSASFSIFLECANVA